MTEKNDITGNELESNAETHISYGKGEDQKPIIAKSGFKQRRSALDSSYTALKYVSQLQRNQIRKSDRVTDIVVFICLLSVPALIFAPTYVLQPPLILSLDILIIAATVFFMIKRLGILITLSERQAVLVWDIVVATLVLGVFLCLNIMLFITYLGRATSIPN